MFASEVLPWASNKCTRSQSHHGRQVCGMLVPIGSDEEENNFSVG